MAALACEEAGAARLGTATCVAGGTISQLLRASTTGTRAPKGDLLLAAALSAAAASGSQFCTTKRAAGQRRELIRQSGSRSYTQQAAALSHVAERACSDSVLSEDLAGPVVHNLRDSRRNTPQHQHQVLPAMAPSPNNKNWYFNLALQSSLL